MTKISKYFEVESGIAAPAPTVAERIRGALNSMEVGESFLVPGSDKESMRSTITKHRRTGSLKIFQTREIDDSGNIRVWRVQ